MSRPTRARPPTGPGHGCAAAALRRNIRRSDLFPGPTPERKKPGRRRALDKQRFGAVPRQGEPCWGRDALAKCVRPATRAMEDGEDLNLVPAHAIWDDIGGFDDDEFA